MKLNKITSTDSYLLIYSNISPLCTSPKADVDRDPSRSAILKDPLDPNQVCIDDSNPNPGPQQAKILTKIGKLLTNKCCRASCNRKDLTKSNIFFHLQFNDCESGSALICNTQSLSDPDLHGHQCRSSIRTRI